MVSQKNRGAVTNPRISAGIKTFLSALNNPEYRDDDGYWQQIEEYIRDHSEADFTHGICSDCVKDLYPEFYLKFIKEMEKNNGKG